MKDIKQTKSNTQTIVLTKEQYFTLAKTVYLGNWMANAIRDGSKEDPHMKEYEEITDHIFSLAPQFGFTKDFEHELECGDHEEVSEVSRLHEEYDENTFWEELSDRLGDRDFYVAYSESEWKKMNEEERFIKRQECDIKWEEEFENNGIERLGIKKK
jgi:hypothetical protein